TAATVLNVTEDHMDRYPEGIAAYRQAKLRIYNHAQYCVINQDDVLTLPDDHQQKTCLSFAAQNGQYCLDESAQWLMVNQEKVMAVNELKLAGLHNYLNALAALALADSVGIPHQTSLAT